MATSHGNQTEPVNYAYLAGILDGEGCLRVSKNHQANMTSPFYQSAVQVGMQDYRVLEMFKRAFGGSVYKERVVHGRLPVYRWRINSKRGTIKLLKKLLPYLVTKKEQAEALMEFCKRTPPPTKRNAGVSPEQLRLREGFYQKMKSLKKCMGPATTECKDTREGEATV